jgi:hypothetical protein
LRSCEDGAVFLAERQSARFVSVTAGVNSNAGEPGDAIGVQPAHLTAADDGSVDHRRDKVNMLKL